MIQGPEKLEDVREVSSHVLLKFYGYAVWVGRVDFLGRFGE